MAFEEETAREELGCEKKTLRVAQWQWDCYKSVARIRLVKTENPGACVPVAPSCECKKRNKSNHPIKNPSYNYDGKLGANF
jgi:hypothetical protein